MSLGRFHMKHDMCILPETDTKAVFDLTGKRVSFLDSCLPVHADMGFDRYVIPDVPRVKVMRTAHAGVFY